MKKVLILGVSAAQLDAIEALKTMGVEAHACAQQNDGPGAAVADVFIEINFTDVAAVSAYMAQHNIDVVYSAGSDLAMPICTRISEGMNKPHFVSSETATICNNKDLLRATFGADFVGNTQFQIIQEIDDVVTLPFPFIMKPADSQGQRGVHLIENETDFSEHFASIKAYSRSGLVILEQYISGPELSVNGYVVDGEIVFLLYSDRETWPQYTGLIHKHLIPSQYANPELDTKVHDLMVRACERLEIGNGPFYAQIKIENNEPYIIEVTPRFDGCHMWKLIRYSTGVDLLETSLKHLVLDQKPTADTFKMTEVLPYTLDFVCQEPHTAAQYETKTDAAVLERFDYYQPGAMIRPVNGVYEKIGYRIYRGAEYVK